MTLEPIPVATPNVVPLAETPSTYLAASIRGVCLRSFVPNCLVDGMSATYASSGREHPWKFVKFKLHLPFGKSIYVAWMIYSYSHDQELDYSYIWRIICLKVVERAGDYPSLLLTYYNDDDALGARKKKTSETHLAIEI